MEVVYSALTNDLILRGVGEDDGPGDALTQGWPLLFFEPKNCNLDAYLEQCQ